MIGAVDLNGVEGVILAVAYLVAQLAAFYAIHKKVTQIDNAVNGRPVGSVTMGQQVETATAVLPLVAEMAPRVKKIEEHLTNGG